MSVSPPELHGEHPGGRQACEALSFRSDPAQRRGAIHGLAAAVLVVLLGCQEDRPGPPPPRGGSPAASEPADRTPATAQSHAFSERARRSLAGGDDGPPSRGGTLTLATSTEPDTLNNILRRTRIARSLCQSYLFPPLLEIDPNTLELLPGLAERRPEVSADRRTYRWRLRRGVLWQRGRDDGSVVEVTTRDVRFSWDMIQHAKVEAAHVRGRLERFAELRVLDDYTFEVTVGEPTFKAEMEFGTQFPLMPAHLSSTTAAAFNRDPLGRDAVGYGPYRLQEWEEGSHITLARSETWWDQERRPFYLERIRFLLVADSERQLSLFRVGELDVVAVQSPDRFEAAKRDPELQESATFHEYYLPQWNLIGWNHRHWAFSDPRVRRAMTLLFPRDAVRDHVYRGHAQILTGPWAISSREYDHSLKSIPFDPRQAVELLTAAGFDDSDQDGVLDREGRAFEFELVHSSTVPETLNRANLLFQQELKKVGILLNLVPVQFSTLVTQLKEHRFDACQFARGPDPRDDDLHPFFHSSQGDGGSNFVLYQSDACDRLLEQYRSEFDEHGRIQIGHRIHRQIQQDQPYTFLVAPQSLVMVSSRIRNVEISRLGARFCEWWIPTE